MTTDVLSINIVKAKKSRIHELDFDNLSFGKVFADHMYCVDYKDGAWKDPSITPYENISISPALSAIHYGQSIFEGMKAYKNDKGEVLLFRPQENFKRMNISAHRMAMPEITEEIFMEGLLNLVKLDQDWIPSKEGAALYVRPFMFAIDDYIGVKASDKYKFMIFTTPVSAYYGKPVKVMVDPKHIRAVQGGVGYIKVSGNYGRSLYPSKVAQEKGYDQILWTDSQEHKYVEESGTMNLMFVIDNVLITPPLGDTILAGITRDSVLTLARDWGMKVEERKISVDEVIAAIKSGKIQEAFGTGTAATIAHISHIGKDDICYELPQLTKDHFSKKVSKELDDIRKGRVADRHNWVVKVS